MVQKDRRTVRGELALHASRTRPRGTSSSGSSRARWTLGEELYAEFGEKADELLRFEGWNVVHSEVVDKRLTELKAERDAWLNELSDEDFADDAAVAERGYAGLRKELATRLGRDELATSRGDALIGDDGASGGASRTNTSLLESAVACRVVGRLHRSSPSRPRPGSRS